MGRSEHEGDEGLRAERLERRRRRAAAQQQTNVAITIGGIVLVLVIIFVVWLSTREPPPPPPEVRAAREKAESERLEKMLPDSVPTVLRRRKTDEELEEEKRQRLYGRGLSGDALRQQIDKEYQAALRRSRLYRKRGDWNAAIKTIEELTERYDDEELRLRVQPELDGLMEAMTDAWKDAKRHADHLAGNHKFRDARQHLLKFAAASGVDAYAEEAKEVGDRYLEQRAAYFAQQYREAITPINAMLPEWKLGEALAEAQKLHFDEPEYQEKLQGRTAELRALVELKTAMMHKINRAMPRISKRAIRAPGMAGEMTGASAAGFKAETTDGRAEEYTWISIGPEAAMRLALLCGDQKDRKHRLAVARLLMEVGHLKRAKMQLEAAKNLGADTAADEERLAGKEPAAGEG